jgi:hypothetical protein
LVTVNGRAVDADTRKWLDPHGGRAPRRPLAAGRE